jgi:hypothetical protein
VGGAFGLELDRSLYKLARFRGHSLEAKDKARGACRRFGEVLYDDAFGNN